MPAQVGAALGEHRVQRAGGVQVERHEHGGVPVAGDAQPHGLGGIEQDGAQGRRDVRAGQASSTRSSNVTSPSSVRWTGHLAAITCSFSSCSSDRWAGRR